MCYYNTYKKYNAYKPWKYYGSKASALTKQYSSSYWQMTMSNENDPEHHYTYFINYINVKYNVSYLSRNK